MMDPNSQGIGLVYGLVRERGVLLQIEFVHKADMQYQWRLGGGGEPISQW